MTDDELIEALEASYLKDGWEGVLAIATPEIERRFLIWLCQQIWITPDIMERSARHRGIKLGAFAKERGIDLSEEKK